MEEALIDEFFYLMDRENSLNIFMPTSEKNHYNHDRNQNPHRKNCRRQSGK